MNEENVTAPVKSVDHDIMNYPEGVKKPKAQFPYVDFVARKTLIHDSKSGHTSEAEEVVRFDANAGWCRPERLQEYLQKPGWRLLGYANLDPKNPHHIAIMKWADTLKGQVKHSVSRAMYVDARVDKHKQDDERARRAKADLAAKTGIDPQGKVFEEQDKRQREADEKEWKGENDAKIKGGDTVKVSSTDKTTEKK